MIVRTTSFSEEPWLVEFDPDLVRFRIKSFYGCRDWTDWKEWSGEIADEKHFPADYIEWLPDL